MQYAGAVVYQSAMIQVTYKSLIVWILYISIIHVVTLQLVLLARTN